MQYTKFIFIGVIFYIPETFCSWTSCPENGVSYLFEDQKLNWTDAARQCEKVGGGLAKVQSIIDANCISRHLKQIGGPFFIGGNKSSSGEWTWIDGTPITQPTFWAPGKYNNNVVGLEVLDTNCPATSDHMAYVTAPVVTYTYPRSLFCYMLQRTDVSLLAPSLLCIVYFNCGH
ncbi:CD209 antigen-like protein A [Saccostrea cucullata]|uniref:CD209 antigen-like protein A n=1 Tax=Saccostrea cuccullata TaxID=36930 RepID=UPI002ED2D344